MSENDPRTNAKFDLWERKLLDLTTRNALLNVKMKGSTVPLLVTSACDIEDKVAQELEYTIISRNAAGERDNGEGQPKEPAIPAKEYEMEDLADTKNFSDILTAGLSENKIYSTLTQNDLEDKLKKLYRESRNALDEDGAGTLFLACGFLKWIDDKKGSTCFAPVVLVPVELTRKFGVGKYVMHKVDDDTIVNITLLEKLKQDFDIMIPELEKDIPSDGSGTDVQGVFDTLKGAVEVKPGWEVIDACVLGMFKFSQFVMWHDMHHYREQIASNKIVRSLIKGSLDWEYEDMESEGRNFSDESSVMLPISADASQLYAIWKAVDGDGASFVLHGPPGTGKSQTITSIIANAIANGKKVLFAAEKKAALDVVYSRLKKIGLDPFCLELHSNKIRKGWVLDQLKTAYEAGRSGISDPEYQKSEQEIASYRDEIRAYTDELSKTRDCGYSLYEILNIYYTYEKSSDVILEQGFENGLNEARVKASVMALEDFKSSCTGLSGKLLFIKAADYSQDTKVRLPLELQALTGAVEGLEKALASVRASFPSLENGSDFPAVANIASGIDRFFAARTKILKTWSMDIFEVDASALKASYEAASRKWALMRSGALKKVYNNVKAYDKTGSAEASFHTHIEDLIAYKNEFSAMGFNTSGAISPVLAEFRAAVNTYKEASDALIQRLGIEELRNPSSFGRIRQIIAELNADGNLIRPRMLLNKSVAACDALKLHPLITAYENGQITVEELVPVFGKAWSKLMICTIIDGSEVLRNFSGQVFSAKIDKLKDLSGKFELVTRHEIYRRLAERKINLENANKDSGSGILQRAIKSHGRGISIRSLLKQVEDLVLELTPCVLMSPMSAAQFIEPSQTPMFDLVIFDEASQLPTCKAAGVIARGKNAVIVGDPNQMPPTSFFKEQSFDEENYDTEDLESILDDCLAIGMPESRLLWHYRSRHESLITFSNRSFYDSKLYTFPSVDDRNSRVTAVKCEGTFDSGKTRTNEAEARAVVDELIGRSKDPEKSGLTCGIVTFNIQQQNLIEDMIDDACRTDEEFEKWAYGGEEPVFIKNLENVQGDERDVILFSVGYGPDAEGKVSMNFGPLNRDGGWRRLNVAATRSRCEMKVFTSLEPEQMRISEATPEGVKAFQRFLMYAEGNSLWDSGIAVSTSNAPIIDRRSEFTGIVREIQNRLEDQGYGSDANVGKSGFKVDIAVIDPNDSSRYCLGILIDGSATGSHSTATSREVSQPQILNGLGWKVMKVWSIDWWEDPDAVIASCIEKIRSVDVPEPEVPEDTSVVPEEESSDEDAKKNG